MLKHSNPESDSLEGNAREQLESAVVRFAGDSGDGMQIAGSQFTLAVALAQNNLVTFPDFPAEIRAPAGSTYGVSAFQIHFIIGLESSRVRAAFIFNFLIRSITSVIRDFS